MRISSIFLSLILSAFIGFIGHAQNESLEDLLKRSNTREVAYISVQELAMPKTEAIIFDTREKEEFNVSHIKDAHYVGYNQFDIDSILQKFPDQDKLIVVYCSLGIRSETIGKKLSQAGYKNVYNLYGGIFEWSNHDLKVVNKNGMQTDSIHAFSPYWGKWLNKGKKVYSENK